MTDEVFRRRGTARLPVSNATGRAMASDTLLEIAAWESQWMSPAYL